MGGKWGGFQGGHLENHFPKVKKEKKVFPDEEGGWTNSKLGRGFRSGWGKSDLTNPSEKKRDTGKTGEKKGSKLQQGKSGKRIRGYRIGAWEKEGPGPWEVQLMAIGR